MKSLYKLIIDIGPLAVFFIFYTRSGLQASILPFMVATVIAVLFSYILEKKIPIMPTVGAAIVLLFGGLTIYFDNDVFFKMKPTIINVLFAVILYGGILINKPLDVVWNEVKVMEDHVKWMEDAVKIDILADNTSGLNTKMNVLTKVGPITLTDIITVTEWKEKESIGVVLSLIHI